MKDLLIFAAITLLAGLGIWYYLQSSKPEPIIPATMHQLQKERQQLETPPEREIPKNVKDLKG